MQFHWQTQYDLPGKCCAKSKQYWTGHFQNFLTFPFGLGLGRCTCFYLNGPKLIGCTRVCEKARLVSRNKKRFNTFGCHCKNPNRNPKLEKSCSKQADVKLRREKREHQRWRTLARTTGRPIKTPTPTVQAKNSAQ